MSSAEKSDDCCVFQEEEFELTDFEDYNDDNGDIFAEPSSSSGVCVVPAACRVLYSFQVIETDQTDRNCCLYFKISSMHGIEFVCCSAKNI